MESIPKNEFDLERITDSGQCFRLDRLERHARFAGVIQQHLFFCARNEWKYAKERGRAL